jgi:hypothetical protein
VLAGKVRRRVKYANDVPYERTGRLEGLQITTPVYEYRAKLIVDR